MPTEQEALAEIFKLSTMYLLLERQQPTQLAIAFEALVQERHDEFHSGEDVSPTSFRDCRNEICVNSRRILEEVNLPALELTEFGAQILTDYEVSVARKPRSFAVVVKKKGEILPPDSANDVLLKV